MAVTNRSTVWWKANAASRGEHKFIRLPRIPTASLPTAAAANEGGIVYDSTTNTVKFSDGSSWANIDS